MRGCPIRDYRSNVGMKRWRYSTNRDARSGETTRAGSALKPSDGCLGWRQSAISPQRRLTEGDRALVSRMRAASDGPASVTDGRRRGVVAQRPCVHLWHAALFIGDQTPVPYAAVHARSAASRGVVEREACIANAVFESGSRHRGNGLAAIRRARHKRAMERFATVTDHQGRRDASQPADSSRAAVRQSRNRRVQAHAEAVARCRSCRIDERHARARREAHSENHCGRNEFHQTVGSVQSWGTYCATAPGRCYGGGGNGEALRWKTMGTNGAAVADRQAPRPLPLDFFC